jgi:predicted acetyltransferase
MELVLPSLEYKRSYIEAVQEYQAEQAKNSTISYYHKLSLPELESDFEKYVEVVNSKAQGLNLEPGYVPQTTYWLVDDGEFIGSANIRHRLNENLLREGGHIGYGIRPSRREQGYGSRILVLALEKAKELGIVRVLVTCDETNGASRKIIERNGGVLENKVEDPKTGIARLRFWIST